MENLPLAGSVKAVPFKPIHGLRYTPEYRVWRSIKERCKVDSPDAEYYADLGVKICDEWADSFVAFYNHVGPRPSPQHSIDRYPDPTGNYEPGNVRWATASEQRKNQRRGGHLLTFNGKTQHVSEWAAELGVNSGMILHRLKRGWTVDQALEPVPRIGNPRLLPQQVRAIREAVGTASLRKIGIKFGVNAQTVLDIQRGKTWRHLI
jgi:hypothetical protein